MDTPSHESARLKSSSDHMTLAPRSLRKYVLFAFSPMDASQNESQSLSSSKELSDDSSSAEDE